VTDPRRLLLREGAAARALEGVVAAERYLDPAPMTVRAAATQLRGAADLLSEQQDQLLFGEGFDVLATEGGWAFGQARRDGYVGWAPVHDLRPGAPDPTHWVSALGTIALAAPQIRAPARLPLTMNALVRVETWEGEFALAEGAGWIPAVHLAPLGLFDADPAAVAERWLGTPYLWGGRGCGGIDCSGLVQQALFACGRGCPRDSDQQALLGTGIPPDRLGRNDLVCWPGHVGIMIDPDRIVHASGVQMAVVIEPLAEAISTRREVVGLPSAHRRLAKLS
jgi:cell wall-associated NlpC family hydrolase